MFSTFLSPVHVSRVPRLVGWKRPPNGSLKLDVDGSSFGNPGRAGFGGLVRSEEGMWLVGFSGNIGVSTNLHAELLALPHGLQVAWDFGAQRVLCCLDSLDVVTLATKSVPPSHRYATIVKSVVSWLDDDWTVTLEHSLREGNACVDMLAKMGAKNDECFTMWSAPPSEMDLLLQADAQRVLFLRH